MEKEKLEILGQPLPVPQQGLDWNASVLEFHFEVGLAPALELAHALAPGGDPEPLLAALDGRLILVGHEPDLSALACRLIGAPAGSLVLRKAGAILLSLGPGAGARLRLLLSPRSLLA
jgi:phosphohistidine phosphatase